MSGDANEAVKPLGLKAKALRCLGVVFLFAAVVGFSSSIQSLVWQLRTRLYYTEGRAAVVSAKIISVGTHSHELYIEHQLDIDGKLYQPTRNTEQHTPSYGNLADAEEALDYFGVGSVHPCWYDAEDPDRYNVIVRYDMDLGSQIRVFCVSLMLVALGWKLVTWGSQKKTKPSDSVPG